MTRIFPGSLSIALALVLAIPSLSRGQNAEGAVTGNGRVVLKRQPALLRMQLMLTADGKDITEAMAKLKAAQGVAGKKLAELEAVEKSVEFGPVQIGGAAALDPSQQYMMRMRGGRGNAPAKQPTGVIVSCTVKAEWPLKAGTPQEVLVGAYTLSEKIKAAGIGKKETKAATPEEQEVIEEAQGLAQGAANPGDPVFQYACRISNEDQAAAMAEAFAKAKADAARQAKAAGAELGNLRHLRAAANSEGGGSDDEREMYMRRMSGNTPAAMEAGQGEATASAPGAVELHVAVMASFDLK
jgi:uncharacterized protein YggE